MPQIRRTSTEVIEFAKENNVEMVDLKMVDLPGTLQHLTVPMSELTEELFAEGTGFDGSSIRGFQTIDESDMLLVPDPNSAVIDPVLEIPTLSLVCDVRDPITSGPYSRDPRNIAHKAEAYLKDSGIGELSYWGPELEFFVFDKATFGQTANQGFYAIDSDEGIWNTGEEFTLGEELNLGHKPRHKEGYFPAPPVDTMTDLRSEMSMKMAKFGIDVEKHHHEVATAGQGEIDFVYDTLTRTADNVMAFKYVVKNVAREHGKTATFMPKPLLGDNGTGMHTHQSIWSGRREPVRRRRVRRDERDDETLHWRAPPPLARPAGLLCADDELLPPAGPRFRGPREFGLLGSQPQRLLPDSHVLQQPEGTQGRVPLPGRDVQSLPGLFGHASGGHRRDHQQDRSWGPAGRGRVRSQRR